MACNRWNGLETLETRLLMSASAGDLEVLGINPIWFEDLLPKWQSSIHDQTLGVTGFADDHEGPFANAPSVIESSSQWIVQLSSEGIAQAGSVGSVFDLIGLEQVGGQVIRGLGLEGMVLIETDSAFDEDQIMATIGTSDMVEYLEADLVIHARATPDDGFFSSLWGLHNNGQSGGTADADIDAPEAWELVTGSDTIVVGVIDTGVDYTHPDLAANIWTNPGEVAGNGIDDDGNGFVDDIHGYDFANNDGDPMDDHGHGTHVAGTISGVGDNGEGVTGVNWSSSIMGLKFLSGSGSGSSSDAVRALNYATMMRTQYGVNIRLTNNSWGGGGSSYNPLRSAIQSSMQADMLFVAAAGNSGQNTDQNPHYPSSYNVANVVSVAATDRNDALATFSNYGANSVDLAAPGVSILSTVPGAGYAHFSGTSMAAPHVAGVAALAWSAMPDATYSEIRNALLAGADDLASLSGKVATGGRLNAYQTLLALGFDTIDPPPDDPNPGPPPPAPGDGYESDDTAAQASDVNTDGVAQYHSIHENGDVDWMRFSLDELSSVVITTAGGTGDTRMWLFASDDLNNEIAFDDDGGSGLFSKIELTANNGLDAGTYYIKVDEFGNNQTIDLYTVRVNASTAPTGDAFEVDDTAQRASTIATDGTGQAHSIHVGNDVDWMQFTLDIRSQMIIETSGGSGDTRMWLYASNGTSLIEYDDDGGAGLFSRIERAGNDALEAGSYTIKVDEFGNNDVIANYTIRVNATPSAPDLLIQSVTYNGGLHTIGLPFELSTRLANMGAAAVADGADFDVEVILSTDTTWGNADDLLTGFTTTGAGLGSGATLDTTITGLVPGSAAEGQYYLGLRVDGGGDVGEGHEANNVWWSTTPDVTLSTTLVLAFGWRTSASFSDANGVDVKVTLRGPGHGEVHIEDGEPAQIFVHQTSARSSLNIQSRSKSHQTIVGGITVNGSLRSLMGRSTDLVGDLVVTGGLGMLALDDVSGQSTINLGGSGFGRGTTITLGSVQEASIDSTAPIRTLSVDEWLDDNATTDRIDAPSIRRLKSRGDFGADVDLTNANMKMTLGRMQVAGRLYEADVHSAGNIGQVMLGAMDGAGLYAGVSANANSMPQGPGDFSMLASIRGVNIRGLPRGASGPGQSLFTNSNIAASSLGRIGLRNVAANNGGGTFGIVADHIKSYQRQDGSNSVRLRRLDAPGPVDTNGNFEVRLV